MKLKQVSTQERSIVRWLKSQVASGCQRVVLQSRVDDVVSDVGEWNLDSIADVPKVADEIRDAIASAEPIRLEPMLFGLFSFQPDVLTHENVAFLLRRAA